WKANIGLLTLGSSFEKLAPGLLGNLGATDWEIRSFYHDSSPVGVKTCQWFTGELYWLPRRAGPHGLASPGLSNSLVKKSLTYKFPDTYTTHAEHIPTNSIATTNFFRGVTPTLLNTSPI
ncbi:hypothetical protein HAX54_045032, partial [Datura stramonium]|nr:hypothetical protein [Datura stramonium]